MGPLVVQKPLSSRRPDVCHAIVVHPPAGIAAGDRLVMDIAAREGAQRLLTTARRGQVVPIDRRLGAADSVRIDAQREGPRRMAAAGRPSSSTARGRILGGTRGSRAMRG
jgi:hypothetical protein